MLFSTTWIKVTAATLLVSFLGPSLYHSAQASPVKAHQQEFSSRDHLPVALYGESRATQQINQAYITFEQYGKSVIGASYYPRSEFHCFIGQVNLSQESISGIWLSSMGNNQSNLQVDLTQLHSISTTQTQHESYIDQCKQMAEQQMQADLLPTSWQQLPAALLQ